MYLWKCWRDTRSSFFAFLSTLLAAGAYAAYVKFDPFGWIAAKPMDSRILWQSLATGLLDTTVLFVPLAGGLFLGALGVGMEFEKGTADFLLTRPRTRRYFLWTSWGLGAAQIVVLMLVGCLFRLARLGLRPIEGPGDFLRSLVALCTLALFCYTVTYLMTTLSRNSRNGTALAILAITGYEGLYAWLHFWYGIEIPFFGHLLKRDSHTAAGFSLAFVAGWLAVCLALMLVAQLRFERAEV
jgi:ABC-type transport system involved in multi-copper enzyme maturation permease subunit